MIAIATIALEVGGLDDIEAKVCGFFAVLIVIRTLVQVGASVDLQG